MMFSCFRAGFGDEELTSQSAAALCQVFIPTVSVVLFIFDLNHNFNDRLQNAQRNVSIAPAPPPSFVC